MLLLVLGLMFVVPGLFDARLRSGWNLVAFTVMGALIFGAAIRMYPWRTRASR